MQVVEPVPKCFLWLFLNPSGEDSHSLTQLSARQKTSLLCCLWTSSWPCIPGQFLHEACLCWQLTSMWLSGVPVWAVSYKITERFEKLWGRNPVCWKNQLSSRLRKRLQEGPTAGDHCEGCEWNLARSSFIMLLWHMTISPPSPHRVP